MDHKHFDYMAQRQEPAVGGVTTEQLMAGLKYHFSHQTFRPNQHEAIMATLSGKDSLLVLPTGGGKSLTFQLPALAKSNCFTVVIGPLLALMKDQVEHCLELGIDARVWNSDVSEEQRKQVLSDLVSDEPEMRLMYTTPESLRNPILRSYLKEAYEAGTLLSFAIDEAHCVSDWGHDFRPAYLELASLRDDFPNTPIAAMTASCTPVVEAGIMKLLQMRNPVLIKGGFNRPNITYKVVYKELIGDGKQDEAVEHLIQFIKDREGQCGIIYARLRATCDWLCSALCSADIDVGCYHAGKDAQRRRKTQQDWSTGATDIVVATVAFGMGIDRADVRWVVHWDVPASVEGFYQESGRSGRDGQPSESVGGGAAAGTSATNRGTDSEPVIYCGQAAYCSAQANSRTVDQVMYVSAEDLDTVSKLEKGNRSGSVAAVAAYSCNPGCRRKKLIDYFGGRRGPCDAAQELPCDYCCQPNTTKQLLQQWEQQVTKRSVQHQLKQQRQQMQDEGDTDQQKQLHQEGNQVLIAESPTDADVFKKQQGVRPRPGVWGSARAQSLPPAVAGYKPHQQKGLSSSGEPVGVLQIDHSNTGQADDSMHSAAGPVETDPAAAGVSGVKVPATGPATRPQLARKRSGSKLGPAAGAFGAFKAPKLTRPVHSHVENTDTSTQIGSAACSGAERKVGSSSTTEQLQTPYAADITMQRCTSHDPETASTQKIVPALEAAALVHTKQSSCVPRRGRGRPAFVPPLRHI